MADEHVTIWKGIANFASVKRETRETRRELERLRAEETLASNNRLASARKTETANTRVATSSQKVRGSLAEVTGETIRANAAARALAGQHAELTRRLDASGATARRAAQDIGRTGDMASSSADKVRDMVLEVQRLGRESRNVTSSGGGGGIRGFFRRIGSDADDGANRVTNAGKKIEKSLGGLSKIGKFLILPSLFYALASAIAPLIGLLGSLGAAGGAAAASLSTLAGAALAIPPALVAMASALGGVLISVMSLGGAFKAFGALQQAQQKNSTAAVSTAQQQSKALRTAEQEVTRAQKEQKKAQEDLNAARRQAKRDLEDLRDEVNHAALDEEAAKVALQVAQEEQKRVNADANASAGDRAEAALKVKEAEANLADTRKKNKRNAEDLAAAEKKGVEGSDVVVAAKDRQTQANIALANAIENLKDTQSGAAGPLSALTEAQNAYNQALAKLSPSARRTVLWITSLKDVWEKAQKTVQESFFSQFVNDLDKLKLLFGPAINFFSTGAREVGKFVDKLIILASSGPFRKDFQTITESTGRVLEKIGDALIPILDGLKDITVAAGPFTEWLADAFKNGAQLFGQWAKAGKESGGIASFLKGVGDRLSIFVSTISNLWGVLVNFGKAALPFGDWLGKQFEAVTAGWKAVTGDPQAQSALGTFFENLKPIISEVGGILGDLWTSFVGLVQTQVNAGDDGMLGTLKTLRNDVLPALGNLFDAISDPKKLKPILDAIRDIANGLGDFIRNGGLDGLTTFLQTLGDVASTAANWAENPFIGQMIKFLGVGLAVGGALGLVFKPIFSLIKALTSGGGSLISGARALMGLIDPGDSDSSAGRWRSRNTDRGRAVRGRAPRTRGRRRGRGLGGLLAGLFGAGADAALDGGYDDGSADDRLGDLAYYGQDALDIVDAVTPDAQSRRGRIADRARARAGARGGARAGGKGIGGFFQRLFGGIKDFNASAGDGGFMRIGAVAEKAAGGGGRLGRFIGSLGKAAPALSKLGGPISKVGGFISKIGPKLLKGGGVVGMIASVAGSIVGDAIKDGQGGARDIAGDTISGVATGAGIGATVGSIIPGVGTAIGAGVGAVVGGIVANKDRIIPLAEKAMSGLGDALSTGWQNIQEGASTAWGNVTSTISTAWDNVTSTVSGAVGTVTGFLSDAWNNITSILSAAWDNIAKIAGPAFEFIKNLILAPFQAARTILQVTWNGITTAFTTARNTIISIFSTLGTALGAVWDRIRGIIATPVEFVVNTVIGGLIDAVNNVLSALRVDLRLPRPSINLHSTRVTPSDSYSKHAKGDWVPGHGNGDTVPAMLTPGEFVIRKRSAQELARLYPGLLESLNVYGASGLKNRRKFGIGGVVDAVASVAKDGARGALSAAFTPLLWAADQFGSHAGVPGQMGAAAAHRLADGVLSSPLLFASGGLVPAAPYAVGGQVISTSSTTRTQTFGDIIIQNPVAEPSSTSLHRTVKKLTSIYGG